MRTIQNEINEMALADYNNLLTDQSNVGVYVWFIVCRYWDSWVNVAE